MIPHVASSQPHPPVPTILKSVSQWTGRDAIKQQKQYAKSEIMNPSLWNPTSPLSLQLQPLGPARSRDEPALPLPRSERSDVGDGDGDRVHTEGLEEVLGLGVDLEWGLSWGQSRDVWDVSGKG